MAGDGVEAGLVPLVVIVAEVDFVAVADAFEETVGPADAGGDAALGFELGDGRAVKAGVAVRHRHTAQQREGILPRELLLKAVHEPTQS